MVILEVTEQDKQFAKQQIEAFKKIDAGKWFEENFKIDKSAKGLDDSGIVDDCDMIINAKKVEIKSATNNSFLYL
jgi:hypothetical protein